MGLKTPLFFAIRRNWGNDIVAITTMKPNGHWFGRYVKDNSATHGADFCGLPDIDGRFATVEAAEAKRAKIAQIQADYKDRRKIHEKAISDLHRDERNAIEAELHTDV